MTKGRNKAANRRRLRKSGTFDIPRDIMLGKACRRGWGCGISA